jgi:hypothetical protein
MIICEIQFRNDLKNNKIRVIRDAFAERISKVLRMILCALNTIKIIEKQFNKQSSGERPVWGPPGERITGAPAERRGR